MLPNDSQLKQALAKMLPETIECIEQMPMCRKELPGSKLINGAWRHHSGQYTIYWKHDTTDTTNEVLDTELLHLCWLVEKTLTNYEYEDRPEHESQQDLYVIELMRQCATWKSPVWNFGDSCNADLFKAAHATWQQRTIALAKVKGITIE